MVIHNHRESLGHVEVPFFATYGFISIFSFTILSEICSGLSTKDHHILELRSSQLIDNDEDANYGSRSVLKNRRSVRKTVVQYLKALQLLIISDVHTLLDQYIENAEASTR